MVITCSSDPKGYEETVTLKPSIITLQNVVNGLPKTRIRPKSSLFSMREITFSNPRHGSVPNFTRSPLEYPGPESKMVKDFFLVSTSRTMEVSDIGLHIPD